jgi:hypothetical protein
MVKLKIQGFILIPVIGFKFYVQLGCKVMFLASKRWGLQRGVFKQACEWVACACEGQESQIEIPSPPFIGSEAGYSEKKGIPQPPGLTSRG